MEKHNKIYKKKKQGEVITIYLAGDLDSNEK